MRRKHLIRAALRVKMAVPDRPPVAGSPAMRWRSSIHRVMSGTAGLLLAGLVGAMIAPDPASATSVMGGSITRSEVMARAAFWYSNRANMIYDKSRDGDPFYPDPEGSDYAPDCSGFVSMALHTSNSSGGYNTRTLPSIATKITDTPSSSTDLRPGDFLDDPGVHTVLFAGWAADHVSFYYYSNGHAPMSYGKAKFSDATLSSHPMGAYKAYRYNHIVEDGTVGPGGTGDGDGGDSSTVGGGVVTADFDNDQSSDLTLYRTGNG